MLSTNSCRSWPFVLLGFVVACQHYMIADRLLRLHIETALEAQGSQENEELTLYFLDTGLDDWKGGPKAQEIFIGGIERADQTFDFQYLWATKEEPRVFSEPSGTFQLIVRDTRGIVKRFDFMISELPYEHDHYIAKISIGRRDV